MISISFELPLAVTKIFMRLKSAGLTAGSREKNRTHPLSPQNRATNPFASSRFSSSGRSRSRTCSSSEKLLQELTDAGGSSFYEDIKRQLAIVQALLPYRE